MGIINYYMFGIGILGGVCLTLWYLHYISPYKLIKSGTYYLKKDILIDGKLYALKTKTEPEKVGR